MHEVYVWGDSHWRVFFPFVNHGSPGVVHEQDGIRMIDMCANELSGATMYGLLNDSSKNGARRRILGDLDRLGGVDNVALVFGEVDARYHNHHYFNGDKISMGRVYDLLGRYRRFIDEDLLWTGRVRKHVFVYHGFGYPRGQDTLLQPGLKIGENAFLRAHDLNRCVKSQMCDVMSSKSITVIDPVVLYNDVSDDGVHLIPERIHPRVNRWIKMILGDE